MLAANKKQVPLKSYSLEIRIDSVNQILKNKEKNKQSSNISMLTRITDCRVSHNGGGAWGAPPHPTIFFENHPIKTDAPHGGPTHLKMNPPSEKQLPSIEMWNTLPWNDS